MTEATAVLDDLRPYARVVLRCPSGRRLADILEAAFDRHLVSVPWSPLVSDGDLAEAATRVGAAAIIDDQQGQLEIAKLEGEEDEAARGLAFIMFTSGSTGRPKGVMLSREAVLGNASKVAALHRFAPDRPHGTCLPLYHANALMMSLLGTKTAGGVLVLAERFEPEDYFRQLGAAGARTASIVPALLSDLLEQRPAWPAPLEYLITAAAPLSRDLAGSFLEIYGPRLRQGYGLSEAVNFSFMTPLLDEAEFRRQYVDQDPPVGLPLTGTRLELRAGEVCLSTPDLMAGYWRDPEATAAVLKDGWLYTGDLGELREDFLVLRGRRSEVINRGGEKIYPLDLERQWRQAGLSGRFAAVPVAHRQLGQEIGLVLAWSTARQLTDLHRATKLRPHVVATGDLLSTSTGKPRRLEMGRRLVSRPESGPRYQALFSHAQSRAAAILAAEPPECARALHVHAAAGQLLLPMRPLPAAVQSSAAGEALDLLAESWPRLADGTLDGSAMMRRQPGLWRRLMTEWPMDSYAELVVEVLEKTDALSGHVLELGSGVGNTTSRIAARCRGEFIWSDREEELVRRGTWPSRGVVFDFDGPPPTDLGLFDTIVATNALHCAADPRATLGRLRQLLVSGGRLYLAEGTSPTRRDGTPWALDMLFAAFDGWWDRGGFRSRWEWLELLESAGFGRLGFTALRASADDLGGVLWGQAA